MKKGFAVKEMLLLVLILAAFAAFAFPRYFWESEKKRAADMDALLADVQLAQEAFARMNGRFTAEWGALAPLLSVPRALGVLYRPVEGTPAEMYFTFMGPHGKPEPEGYIVRLEPAPGPQETAFVAARRVGGRFEYVLRRMLPYGPTRCEAQTPQSERFCKRLEQYLQAESFVPQEPAPGENTPQESAPSGVDNTAAQGENTPQESAPSGVDNTAAQGENTPQESALSGADNTAAQEEPAGDVPAL